MLFVALGMLCIDDITAIYHLIGAVFCLIILCNIYVLFVNI